MNPILFWVVFVVMGLASVGGLILLFNPGNQTKRAEPLPIIIMILVFLAMLSGVLKGP